MTGYTKLFASIVASTIWREDDKTRLVWITMLALKNRMHVVEASVPGLADMARVSLDECVAALDKLKSPDEWSRTKTNDGRRIQEIPGGWLVLNGEEYCRRMSYDERKESNRIYQQNCRARKKASQLNVSNSNNATVSTAVSNVTMPVDGSAKSAHADADPDAVPPIPPTCQQSENGEPDNGALVSSPKTSRRSKAQRPPTFWEIKSQHEIVCAEIASIKQGHEFSPLPPDKKSRLSDLVALRSSLKKRLLVPLP